MWLGIGIVISVAILGGAVGDRLLGYRVLDKWFPRRTSEKGVVLESKRLVNEESVVIDVVEKVSPSVVTVGIKKTQRVVEFGNPLDPFDVFGFRGPGGSEREEKIERDIGTGFIVSKDGLVVTNKHVVSDTSATYRVFTQEDKELTVEKIYRDPVNDLAILEVSPAAGLKPVELGDSSRLKVGQFVITIGTALGEFRNTVTTGVISGLGRGITAGDPFGDFERLDNVIQTDAAINPGNSGGPLLNSSGEVIGVNVAVASSGQNIGFALPINLVKESVENFKNTGRFSRPYLGVRYRMIDRKTAILNEVPQGAFVQGVVQGSPAEKAGIVEGDILVGINDRRVLDEEGGLVKMMAAFKVGERISISLWRDGEERRVNVFLEEAQ